MSNSAFARQADLEGKTAQAASGKPSTSSLRSGDSVSSTAGSSGGGPHASPLTDLGGLETRSAEKAARRAAEAKRKGLDTYGVLDHDLIVWVGDLNYRIDDTEPSNQFHLSQTVQDKDDDEEDQPLILGSAGALGLGPSRGQGKRAQEKHARHLQQQQQQEEEEGEEEEGEEEAEKRQKQWQQKTQPDQQHRPRMSYELVHQLLRAGRADLLLPADQLSMQRAAGNVFQGFKEAAVRFLPTYKFIVSAHAPDHEGSLLARLVFWH